MWANIFVAATNFPVFVPVATAMARRDMLTAITISYVGAASFLSHLVENHKHGMPGIGFSKKTSYLLNRLDVLGCILVGVRFGYLYLVKYGFSIGIILDNKLLFSSFCIPFIFMRISEYDKYNPALKNMYIATHSIWHLTIFMVIDVFLKKFIYH